MKKTNYKEVYRIYVNSILYDVFYNNTIALENVAKLEKKFKSVIIDLSNNKPITKAERKIIENNLI